MTHFKHLEYGKKDRLLLLRLGCKETSYAPSLASFTYSDGGQLLSCELLSVVLHRQGGRPRWTDSDKLRQLSPKPRRKLKAWFPTIMWLILEVDPPPVEPPDETAALNDTLTAACERPAATDIQRACARFPPTEMVT